MEQGEIEQVKRKDIWRRGRRQYLEGFSVEGRGKGAEEEKGASRTTHASLQKISYESI